MGPTVKQQISVSTSGQIQLLFFHLQATPI